MLFKTALASLDPWAAPQDELLAKLETPPDGLSEAAVRLRVEEFGPNELEQKKKRGLLLQFLSYFFTPLNGMLAIIVLVSFYTDNVTSAAFIALMILLSVCLTFWREYAANDTAEKLRKLVRNTATVLRAGKEEEAPIRLLVPGDLILLNAGDMVPADCRVLACKDFFVNQASLTGESLPIEKQVGESKPGAAVTELKNVVFLGSSVVSGTAKAVVVKTGQLTQFGEVARRLQTASPETSFEKGVKAYSLMMIKFITILVVVVLSVNAALKHDFIESLLFALAVAVGLTPEMLPVIVTTTLSKGATEMAKKDVIVKRIASIQNLGAMDVLCTDKTGTLTEDKIVLERYVNLTGAEDTNVLTYAYLNSFHQTGLKNPLDKAIIDHQKLNIAAWGKVDEIPFDFLRRRMSVAVKQGATTTLVTKGAPENMLAVCARVRRGKKLEPFDSAAEYAAKRQYQNLSADGYRVLAVATKTLAPRQGRFGVSDEKDLTLEGFIAFLDPPKTTAKKSLRELMKRGIEVKILSGDNEWVNQKIAKEVGLKVKGLITGPEVAELSDESLRLIVERRTIFARVLPIQKDRIIAALQKNGHVVGYLGDGINDAPALKTADVGISVNTATDIAKEAADMILLRKSLHALYDGVDEGRKTFSNTLKYIKMGCSSNFGNMFSVVGASIFLPFLPMLPVQILLNNLLYDFSQLAIPSDRVDEQDIAKPRKWDIGEIQNFMVVMGPVSSLFDYLTFGALLFLFHAGPEFFHTGWFIEGLLTQTLVVHAIRTNRVPFLESTASPKLILSTLAVCLTGMAIAFTPLGAFFQFIPLPTSYLGVMLAIVALYLLTVHLVKTRLVKTGRIQ